MRRREHGLLSLLLLATMLLGGCFARNAVPVVSFWRSPAAGSAPLTVYFDASESVDPEGESIAFSWVFGDGATDVGAVATHTYVDPGLYEVILTVTDVRGAEGELRRMVDVSAPGVEPTVGLEAGNAAPDFELPDLFTGELVSLSDLRGYVVLLDFWASSCTPCQLTMPHLESLREAYGAQGLLVVAVNVDASEDDARRFVEDGGYGNFIVLRDATSDVRALYEVEGIPHTYVIDRQGIVRADDHPIRIRDRDIEPWL